MMNSVLQSAAAMRPTRTSTANSEGTGQKRREGCHGVLCEAKGCPFFFSSRRRHTRCGRNCSSDVCSSDLGLFMLRPLSALLFTALLGLTGCQSAYYAAMEKVGVHKRDILVDRVEEARDSQQEAKEQFQSALDRYRSVVQVKSGELEARYEALNKEYLASESSAKEVRARIEAVEDVAEA